MDETFKKSYQILQPFLLAFMVVLGIVVGRKIDQSGTPESAVKVRNIISPTPHVNTVEEVNKFIQARYIDSVNTKVLNDIAIKNMVKELDPFSTFLPNNYSTEQKINSFFQAYGFFVENINNKWRVTQIRPGTPAYQKLEPGDQVLKINDTVVHANSFNQWTDTLVRLIVLQKNKNYLVDIPRIDFAQNLSSVDAHVLNSSTAYIKISHFTDNTYDDFITALDSHFTKKNIRDLVIDLRENPGGYMEECSRVLNQLFKEKNILLTSTEGRTVRKMEYKTDGRQLFDLKKLAVIVNENTASAAEVFAGAIQDLERGKIIGKHTYGKGLVQEQYMLSDGSALRLSVARFYLPSGRTVGGSNLTQKEKKYYSVGKRLLKSGNYIFPDINITESSPTEVPDKALLEYILDQKSNHKSSADPVQTIYKKKLSSKKKWTIPEKNALLTQIKKYWGSIQKDEKSIVEYQLLSQPEIQAALNSLK